ncbi:MAG: hypothetical protein PHH59_16610 [Methylovulum sp.]|nr:hypothetical protein [Methylovulum sp.]MDD2725624.1 hypothetical protein [Methylovulum sp.]MDD5125805.1 hypothetical protein [Methylovulum sp.]
MNGAFLWANFLEKSPSLPVATAVLAWQRPNYLLAKMPASSSPGAGRRNWMPPLEIGGNALGIQGDVANLADLDIATDIAKGCAARLI